MTEEDLFKHHLLDLARQSERQSRYTYSAFLSLPEQNMYREMNKELSFVSHRLYAPVEQAERQIVVFGSEEELGYAPEYPVCVLKVSPLSLKFGEELTHRDCLGAVLNLGIERELIGDLLIREKTCWIFCLESIKDFLLDNLTRIKHTEITLSVASPDLPELKPRFSEVRFNVASERIDSTVAAFTGLSRSKAVELFSRERVFVNGKVQTSLSYNLKEGDVLSVRGFGKAIYKGIDGTSKKGRLYVKLNVYR